METNQPTLCEICNVRYEHIEIRQPQLLNQTAQSGQYEQPLEQYLFELFGPIALISEQVNPHPAAGLPATPPGPAVIARGQLQAEEPLPVGDRLGDLPPKSSCDKKCNGDLVGPHQCQRPKRGLRITYLSDNCMQPFTTKNNFNRHCKTVHGLRQLLFHCTAVGCKRRGKGFSRRDNLLQHSRRVHGEDIPEQHFRVQGSNWGFEA